MTNTELEEWRLRWSLSQVDAAKVLVISTSKMSEFINDKRKVPPYIAAHTETFNLLSDKERKKLIARRTK